MTERFGARDRLAERRQRLGRGRRGELAACALLLAKGYRILARRHVTPYGEVDIIAARWDRLAFVEVKRRAALTDAEAALTPAQGARIARAADDWLSRHPAYLDRAIGLDAVLVTGRGWPQHIPNALDQM
ncbi:MAG: YraN family protein [Hyphomicrobiaceae bacterium]